MYLPITPYQKARLPIKKRKPRDPPITGIFDEPFDTLRINKLWRPHIMGNLQELLRPELWTGELDETNAGVQGVLQFMGTTFTSNTLRCELFGMQSNFISYTPQNPYSEPNFVPDGYITAPFQRYDGGGSLPSDYLEGDIYVPFTAINANPFDVFGGKLPQIEIGIRGSAEIEFKFLQFPLAGAVVVSVNNPPDVGDIIAGILNTGNAQVIDLELDVTSIPPETDILLESDLSITQGENDESIIYLTFIPVLDDSFTPVRYGGGIRAIEICGVESTEQLFSAQTLESYNPNNYQEGLIVATYEDLRRAVRDGTLDVYALALAGAGDGTVSNVNSPVVIAPDDNGNPRVSIDTSGATQRLPEGEFTADEIAYGGAFGVANGFKSLVDETSEWVANSVSVANIVTRYRQFFNFAGVGDAVDPVFDAIDSTITAAYASGDPQVDTTALANIVYCSGRNNKANLYRYALEVEALDNGNGEFVAIADFFRALIDSLELSQLASWYEIGTKTPRTGYELTSCYLPPAYEFTFTADDLIAGAVLVIDEQPVSSGARLYRLEVSGEIVNSVGEKWNGVYLQGSSGTYIYNSVVLRKNSGYVTNYEPENQPVNNFGDLNAMEYRIGENNSSHIINAVRMQNGFDRPEFIQDTPVTGQLNFKLIRLE